MRVARTQKLSVATVMRRFQEHTDEYYAEVDASPDRTHECCACKTRQHLSLFNRAWWRANGHQGTCKACRAKHAEMLRVYGVTREQYEAMLRSQGGACAVCLQTFVTAPQIDHCHGSGRIRGLLCPACNMALGLFRDEAGVLLRAVRYLKQA